MAENAIAAPMRVCTKCLEAKPATLAFFPPHKIGRYGLFSRCVPCKKLDDAERRSRPDQKARQKAWRDANKEAQRVYGQAYRAAGYSSSEHVKSWAASNPERFADLEKRKAQRRALSVKYQLRTRLSARLRSMLVDKRGKCTDALLGFSADELKRHLERQFTRGMSWHAFLAGRIHIDHIVPVAAFSVTSVDDPDFKVCWALTNLRPMWARDNIVKGAKRLTLL